MAGFYQDIFTKLMNASKHLQLKQKRVENYVFLIRKKKSQDFMLESICAVAQKGIPFQLDHKGRRNSELKVLRAPGQGFPGVTFDLDQY